MIVWLCIEATARLMHPDNINIESDVMIITSFLSLGCNLFNLFALTDLPCCKRNKEPEKTEEEKIIATGDAQPALKS